MTTSGSRHAPSWTLLAALGLGLGLAVSPGPCHADDVPVWNGRDSVKEVKKLAAEYFDATAERRAEIRAVLDELGTLSERDAKTWAKSLRKEARKHGPKITKKSGEAFTHGKLTGTVHKAGRPKRRGGWASRATCGSRGRSRETTSP